MRELLRGPYGQVEVVSTQHGRDWVLYFHGGHESAVTASAAQLYEDLGYNVLAISRPGYGATNVGPMAPDAFANVVDQVRDHFSHECYLAVVGTSFGGPQAVAYASRFPTRARSLILHSAAPSSRPYPDKAMQRLLGPVVFHPVVEGLTWKAVSLLMRLAPSLSLRFMTAPLSTHPTRAWLKDLDSTDRQQIRELFFKMRSGSGFNNDVRHAGLADSSARRRAQQRVVCPTLITASRSDGGVSWLHAEDFHATIRNSRLVEIAAVSHLFWIGPARSQVVSAIQQFLASVAS
jgi:pimeloyl-ACP methyl ester carboxylesterase